MCREVWVFLPPSQVWQEGGAYIFISLRDRHEKSVQEGEGSEVSLCPPTITGTHGWHLDGTGG